MFRECDTFATGMPSPPLIKQPVLAVGPVKVVQPNPSMWRDGGLRDQRIVFQNYGNGCVHPEARFEFQGSLESPDGDAQETDAGP